MWLNLTWLIAAGGVLVAAFVLLSVRFMPRPVMRAFGIACTSRSGCVALVPPWAQWAIWSISIAVLIGLLGPVVHSLLSGTIRMGRMRRMALATGKGVREETRLSPKRLVVLDGPRALAFTVGVVRPVIVLSKDLVQTLDRRELEAVVAHESAHIAGKDNLILLVAHAMARALWFLPGVKTAHHNLRRAVEMAADGRARGKLGDGLIVAASLHRFASLMSVRSTVNRGARSPVLASFADDGLIVERIGRLLDESERVISRFRSRLAVVALVVLVLAFTWGTYSLVGVNLDLGSHPPICTEAGHAPTA